MESRRLIGQGDELIELLGENGALLDAEVEELGLFGLSSASPPTAYLWCFRAGHQAYHESCLVRLELRGVTRFDLFDDDFVGYFSVERYKFLRTEQGDFYLSFDPYLENGMVAEEEDNAVIRAAEVYGFLIDRSDTQSGNQAVWRCWTPPALRFAPPSPSIILSILLILSEHSSLDAQGVTRPWFWTPALQEVPVP